MKFSHSQTIFQVSFTVGSDGGYFFKTALNLKDSYASHFQSLRFKEGYTLYPGKSAMHTFRFGVIRNLKFRANLLNS